MDVTCFGVSFFVRLDDDAVFKEILGKFFVAVGNEGFQGFWKQPRANHAEVAVLGVFTQSDVGLGSKVHFCVLVFMVCESECVDFVEA